MKMRGLWLLPLLLQGTSLVVDQGHLTPPPGQRTDCECNTKAWNRVKSKTNKWMVGNMGHYCYHWRDPIDKGRRAWCYIDEQAECSDRYWDVTAKMWRSRLPCKRMGDLRHEGRKALDENIHLQRAREALQPL